MKHHILLSILILAVCIELQYAKVTRVGRRRIRHMPSFPARNESRPEHCGPREHFVRCGPERHCDRSCENMYSPPHCVHNPHHPKCYFPRCLCKEGFLRDENGRCIRPSRCPTTVNDVAGEEFRSHVGPHSRPRRRHRYYKLRDRHFY